MCGRYARFSSVKAFAERFHAQGTLTLTESYNVAPTQAVLLARNAEDGGRELATLHWGFIPAWSTKQPPAFSRWLFSRLKTGEPFAFAGLWEWWEHEPSCENPRVGGLPSPTHAR